MAPVILSLREELWADVTILATAQHRELLDQVLDLFKIRVDIDLNVMRPNQALSDLTARLVGDLDQCFADIRPDAILVQGDTTTVMVAALAAFYRKIPFGHVEAGLRTGNMHNPFPEEMNRVLASHLARWHFAPTQSAKENLLREGIPDTSITVTGNTVIDALYSMSKQSEPFAPRVTPGRRLILVTAHRRENFGKPLEDICYAIQHLADSRPDVEFLYPVHPNPNVKCIVERVLSGHQQVMLCEPLPYLPFVAAMKSAYFILSDSGGVQEEAPALGKPILVLRNETERPEAVDAGVAKLVGTSFDRIVRESTSLLDDEKAYQVMARGVSPYGDGNAASRIVSILKDSLVKKHDRA